MTHLNIWTSSITNVEEIVSLLMNIWRSIYFIKLYKYLVLLICKSCNKQIWFFCFHPLCCRCEILQVDVLSRFSKAIFELVEFYGCVILLLGRWAWWWFREMPISGNGLLTVIENILQTEVSLIISIIE